MKNNIVYETIKYESALRFVNYQGLLYYRGEISADVHEYLHTRVLIHLEVGSIRDYCKYISGIFKIRLLG